METIFFTKREVFGQYEQGMLLSRIIEMFPTHIGVLGNVRAMIDYKFDTYTRNYFMF